MNKTLLIVVLFTIYMIIYSEGRKTSRGRGSGGSSSGRGKKTNYNPQPAPTSFSSPQASAPKPSLFGWQERPAQKSQTFSSWQSKPSSGQSHSYPSSNTGLSGNNKQSPTYQESVQRSSVQNVASQQVPSRTAPQSHTNNQPSHSYPSSNGLSGSGSSSGGHLQQSGSGYPQQQASGLSGSGAAPPPYPGKPGDVNRPYNTGNYPTNNFGNNNHHPQGPPPPYTNYGSNYGGYGGYGGHPSNTQQMPGYFGNHANYGKGFGGGVSRSGSALTGVGIAGAGVGTLLTGLALWNLARSTGHQHHTVIYDNRGQPVAVAPANNSTPVMDPMLADLVNCTLTISSENATEVLAIPCAIATSFSPEADVKDVKESNNANDNTKCTVTVLTKTGKEYMTTIPCSILLNTAAENNVTEPPVIENNKEIINGTMPLTEPTALRFTDEESNNDTSLNCTPLPGEIRDPINPCYTVTHNLTVIPLNTTEVPEKDDKKQL